MKTHCDFATIPFQRRKFTAGMAHCWHGKRPKPTASRAFAMKTLRSGGGEYCVFVTPAAEMEVSCML